MSVNQVTSNQSDKPIKQNKRWLNVLLILVLPPLCLSVFLDSHIAVLSIFISIILLWLSETLPLGITALLIPCLTMTYGLTDANDAFLAFGNKIIFLFVGVFLHARALENSGLLKRIANYLLLKTPGSHSPRSLTLFVAVVAWFASMWMSNTAACAVLVPLALGIATRVGLSIGDETERKKLVTRLLIACAFGASIGGIATPIGSPPNLLALEYLSRLDKSISFAKWLFVALPLSFTMLLSLLFLLEVLFPIKHSTFPALNAYLKNEMSKTGPWSQEEQVASSCFLLAVGLWLAPGVLEYVAPGIYFVEETKRILTLESVAVCTAALLFILPAREGPNTETLLGVHDLRLIDWNTILLFGGGLTLGNLLSDSGVAQEIGLFLLRQFGDNFFLFGVACCGFAVITSEFSSNTASAAIILPLIFGSVQFSGAVEELILGVAFAASYGFMLPVSTPPNAIAYGTEQLELKDLTRAGFIFDILGIILISSFMLLLLPKLDFL